MSAGSPTGSARSETPTTHAHERSATAGGHVFCFSTCMASLFVRRPNQHYHLLAVIVLFAMLVLMAIALDGHKPLPGGY